jgi:hypothetical protein
MTLVFTSGETLAIPKSIVPEVYVIRDLLNDLVNPEDPIPICNEDVSLELVQDLINILQREDLCKLESLNTSRLIRLYIVCDYLDVPLVRRLVSRTLVKHVLMSDDLTDVNMLSSCQWSDVFSHGPSPFCRYSKLLGYTQKWDSVILNKIRNKPLRLRQALELVERVGHAYELKVSCYLSEWLAAKEVERVATAPLITLLHWDMSWMRHPGHFASMASLPELETLRVHIATESPFLFPIPCLPSVKHIHVPKSFRTCPFG